MRRGGQKRLEELARLGGVSGRREADVGCVVPVQLDAVQLVRVGVGIGGGTGKIGGGIQSRGGRQGAGTAGQTDADHDRVDRLGTS